MWSTVLTDAAEALPAASAPPTAATAPAVSAAAASVPAHHHGVSAAAAAVAVTAAIGMTRQLSSLVDGEVDDRVYCRVAVSPIYVHSKLLIADDRLAIIGMHIGTSIHARCSLC